MFWKIFCSTILTIFFDCCLSSAGTAAERGLFIWSLDKKQVLSSKFQIDHLIDFAHKKNIKILFVQVYRANKAWFPTQHADTSDYDAAHQGSRHDSFTYLIKEAHRQGIKVHAWMNMLSLSANVDAPILKKYGPGILTHNREPKKTLEDYKIDKQFFLEPSDPMVQKELLALVEDLLKKQKYLDGVLFDYIRYPDVHPFYGYSAYNMERFKKQFSVKEIIEEDPRWKQFKRDQVTSLLEDLVKKTRAIRPKIHISTTGCLSYARAYHEALQEWPLWIRNNLIEFVTLMNYPLDFQEYEKNIKDTQVKIGDLSRVNMGLGAYKFEKGNIDTFKQQFKYCQASGVRACVVFHYGNLVANPNLEEVL